MDVFFAVLISLIALAGGAFIVISTIGSNRLEAEARERIPSAMLDALEPKWFSYVHSALMTSICVVIVVPWFDEVDSIVRWLIGVYISMAALHGWFFFRTRRLVRKFFDQIPEGSMGVFRWAEITHAGFTVLAGIAGIISCFVGS